MLTDRSRNLLLQWANRIARSLGTISEYPEAEIPKKVIDVLHSIGHYKSELVRLTEDSGTDIAALKTTLTKLLDRSRRLTEALEANPVSQSAFDALVALNNVLRNMPSLDLGNDEHSLERNVVDHAQLKRVGDALAILSSQLASAQNESNHVRRELRETARLAEDVGNQAKLLDEKVQNALENTLARAESITADLLAKQDDVNKLVGMVTGSTIAGSFAKTADDERKLANSTRNGSVLLMLTIVMIVGFSFFETTSPKFDWQTGTFRLLFSIALSVPAAYLARESSKHRAQQYSHLRVALDLQAITPYLASLPTEDQHKLKMEVANKIFGAKGVEMNQIDSYPININDLLTALISRIDARDSKTSTDRPN